MQYNFYIDYDGTGYKEFFPAGFSPFKRNRKSDQYFVRYGWGELTIKNNPDLYSIAANPIYKLYDIISALDFTQEILFKFTTTLETIEGYAGVNDFHFNLDEYTVTVSPAIKDRYTDLLENWEEKIDFSDYPLIPSSLEVAIDNSELKTRVDWGDSNYGKSIIKEKDFTDDGALTTSQALARYFNINESPKRALINFAGSNFADNDGLWLKDREAVRAETDYELSNLTIWVGEKSNPLLSSKKRTLFCDTTFSRDEIIKVDVINGSDPSGFEPPPGDGWNIKEPKIIEGQNAHLWTRLPFNGVFTDDWDLKDEISNPNTDGTSPNFTWYKKRTTSVDYPTSENTKTINSSIHLKDALEYLYNRTLPTVAEDVELDASFTANSNPVTLETHSMPLNVGASDYPETQSVPVNSIISFFESSTKNRIVKLDLDIAGAVTSPSIEPKLGLRINIRIKDATDTIVGTISVFNNSANSDSYLFSKVQSEQIELLAGYSLQIEDFLYESTSSVSYSTANISISSTENTYQTKSVISTFFFNDLDAVFPIDAYEGLNYVTSEPNYLNNSKIFFTRDIQESLDTEEVDSIPETTFKAFYDDLNKLYKGQLFFIITDDGDIRIEHIAYIDLTKTTSDIRGDRFLKHTSNWNFEKSEMFNLIELYQVNSGYQDFTNNKITYNKIVSNNRNVDLKFEFKTSQISTDVRYMIENSSDLEAGIVLVITDDAETLVLNKIGRISGGNETNGYAAYSNLLYDFGKYEGVWNNGVMNGEDVSFKVTKRNKIGQELILQGLKNSLFYTTNIGIGIVDSGEVDFENGTTKIKLRYRYNSSAETDQFVIIFEEDVWADFANYET